MADLQDNDKELLARLLKHLDLEESQDRLTAQGITTVSGFRKALNEETPRKHLQKALQANGATVAHMRMAEWIEKEDKPFNDIEFGNVLGKVDRTILPAEPVRVAPKAEDALKTYLGKKGIGAEMMPIFEKQGVTSMSALQRVVAKRNDADKNNEFSKLASALGKETDIDGTRYMGGGQLAESLKSVSLQDLDDARGINGPPAPSDFSKTGLDADAKNRYAQLKEAVQEVDALRQKDEKAADKLLKDISAETKSRLESILTRVNAKGLLKEFEGRPAATMKDLNASLNAVSEQLSKDAWDSLSKLFVEKDGFPKGAAELAKVNFLKRGLLITATGIYECSGSDLVAIDECGEGTPGAYEEVISDYESEQNYQFAEKTIKESSHTYANSNSILGGFFTSSGIGAISGAFRYAQSTMSSEAKERAKSTSRALKVKERSIYAPKAVITLPREKIKLSGTAEQYLKQIALADDKDQGQYAKLFLANFGGHVFRSVTLGGRYSYVARAESSSSATREEVDTALSEAQKKAGSLAGGFFGKFLFGASTAHDDETTSTSATSMITTVGAKKQVVRVNIVVRGGLQEMPLEQWKLSLIRRDWWRVIDRREAVAVWDLLRTTELIGLKEDERKDLANILEKTWVQDVFVDSLMGSELANYGKFSALLEKMKTDRNTICTVKALESALLGEVKKLETPNMVLRYISAECTQESRGGRYVVTLPPSWKILSGGGGTPTNKSQVLIESYPDVAIKNGKPVWEWHLKTKGAACDDGVCGHSNATKAMAKLKVGLIALYDPQDEWDVKLMSENVFEEMKHNRSFDMDPDYVLVGGGVCIKTYGRPTMTGSGFPLKENASLNDEAPLRSYHVKTKNMETKNCDNSGQVKSHALSVYAIGIRARNRAPLEPIYTSRVFKDGRNVANECHLEGDLIHDRGQNNSPMIGGGVWVTGDMNFLSWSMPELESGGLGRWKAYSADRAGFVNQGEMHVVTIGLKNVKAMIEKNAMIEGKAELPSGTVLGFEDTFTKWNEAGRK
jgi:hypothetical protein